MWGVGDIFVQVDQQEMLSAYHELVKAVDQCRSNVDDWRKSLPSDTFDLSILELEVFEEAIALIKTKLKPLYPF